MRRIFRRIRRFIVIFKCRWYQNKGRWSEADERWRSELTRLRAERDNLNDALNIAMAEVSRIAAQRDEMRSMLWCDGDILERGKAADAQYTALLIDLRALVEQWQKHSAQILRGLTAAADPQPVQLEFEAASRIYRACADELKARLSREPHQD